MLDRYRELTGKVDAFFTRVEDRHRADLACAVGCTMCCHTRLTVTGVEAAVLRESIAAMPAPARVALATHAARPVDPDDPRCAALADDGRCLVYDARPLVCRSHGVPIRTRGGSLPVISACEKNFTARGPDAADADCILDQETLSTVLLAIDAAHAQATDRVPGARVELAALLVEAATAPVD